MHSFNLTHSQPETSWLRRWWTGWCSKTWLTAGFTQPSMAKSERRALAVENGSVCEGISDFEFYGRHLMANYVGCDPVALSDNAGLKAAFESAIKSAGATILDRIDYAFTPAGMTAVMLLSESHASIHTYPEHQACFVDLFTCGRNCSAEKFDEVLTDYLRPQHVQRRTMLRHEHGIEESSGVESDCWAAEWAA
jgi:S-adenosylmethionine decarboxylase